MNCHGKAVLLEVHQLDENARCIDYYIDPPAVSPRTGTLESVVRVAVFPDTLDKPDRIVQVTPPNDVMYAWFQFQFPHEISDREALERIGYELVEAGAERQAGQCAWDTKERIHASRELRPDPLPFGL